MSRGKLLSGLRWRSALCAALIWGFGVTSVFGGIDDTIEIDGNMKDNPKVSGVDWCSLIDGTADPAVVVEIFDGAVGDCGTRVCDGGPCCATPQDGCSGDIADRFFTGGGSKDKEAISCDDGANQCWKHEIDSGGPNDKTNIQNGLIALLIDPVNGHEILAFAGDLLAQNGTAEIGVWLLAEGAEPICDPDEGLWDGRHHPDDVQILASFTQGGRFGTVAFRRIQTVNADGSIVFVSDEGEHPAANSAAAAINEVTIPAADSCWPYQNKFISGGPAVPYLEHPPTTFFSAAIDLTANGLDRCFNTFVLQTRTSQSTPATYKDWIAGEFDTCRDICGTKNEAARPACGETADCTDITGTLSGWSIILFEDTDGENDPDAGELVTQDGNGQPVTNPVLTGPDGSFAFHSLPNGNRSYILCEVVPPRGPGDNFDWVPCAPDPGKLFRDTAFGDLYCYNAFNLPEDQCGALSRDFTNFQNPACAIVRGTKYCDENGNGQLDAGEEGLAGFCITLTEADTSSESQLTGVSPLGGYNFVNIEAGQTVTVCEHIDGTPCSSLDNSTDWVATTATCGDVNVPANAANDQVFPGPNFGNASKPDVECNTRCSVADTPCKSDGDCPIGQTCVAAGDEYLDADADCDAHFCFTTMEENLCGAPATDCTANGPAGSVPLVKDANGIWCGDFPGPDGSVCPAKSTVTCTVETPATDNIPALTDVCSFDVDVDDVTPPQIDCEAFDATDCEGTVRFEATVTDNCCVDKDAVTVSYSDRAGVATGKLICSKQQVDPQTVTVSCSIDVDASDECPAAIEFTVNASDCCGNNAVAPCTDTANAPCCGCRVTGGGVDCDNQIWTGGEDCNGALGQMKKIDGTDVYTFGGQAGAPTESQPQPWGEWTHRQHDGPSGKWTFHAGTASAPPGTEIDSITCADPGYCRQARPAPFKQIYFDGVGSFKNVINPGDIGADDTLRWFEVHIEDLGEPGRNGTQRNPPGFCPDDGYNGAAGDCRCPDFYRISIHATSSPTSAVVYEVDGFITGGNLQLHPPVGQ